MGELLAGASYTADHGESWASLGESTAVHGKSCGKFPIQGDILGVLGRISPKKGGFPENLAL